MTAVMMTIVLTVMIATNIGSALPMPKYIAMLLCGAAFTAVLAGYMFAGVFLFVACCGISFMIEE